MATNQPRKSPSARLSRSALFVCGLAGLSLVLSGCLSTGFNYISHKTPDNTEVSYNVPSKWKIFNFAQVLRAANGHLTQATINQLEGSSWLDAFSPAPKFTAGQASFLGTNYPIGMAMDVPISSAERGSFSISELRSEILGSDPFALHSPYGVVSYSEFTVTNGGLRGIKMTVEIPSGGNFKTSELGEVAVVDAATNWYQEIGIGCNIKCWTSNEGIINHVLDSWLVKER